MTLADQVRTAGVVGAGGAGFPAHIKVDAGAEIVIANGAECERNKTSGTIERSTRSGRLSAKPGIGLEPI